MIGDVNEMSKKQEIQRLERQLANLLGKMSCVRTAWACRGKSRGRRDYGLTFDDGSYIFISRGYADYAEKLCETIAEYRYFRTNHARLADQIRLMIERDNRQAAALGLAPVEFVRLELNVEKTDAYVFWTQTILRHNGGTFCKRETMNNYACLGYKTDEYFTKKINRPDDALGSLEEFGKKDFVAIIFGYLYEREELESCYII
jgi:hypothetical protein